MGPFIMPCMNHNERREKKVFQAANLNLQIMSFQI